MIFKNPTQKLHPNQENISSINSNMYFNMLHTNKSLRPSNSRERMTGMHRNILLEQKGSQERKTEKIIHIEKKMQVEETEPDVIVEQGDEIGCGDELAQEIDLDFVEGLEEGETFMSEDEEESMDESDSCSKRDVDDNIETEPIEVEDTGKIAWRLTKNGVSTLHKRSSDVPLASNAVYGCTVRTDRFLYDEICINKTFIEAFYPNGIVPGRMFSSEEDIEGMFPDICDAGEALADKDGLSECDLFEQTEPLQITETEDNANGDVMMLTLEEGLNGSDLSSTSIEEEDDEIQLENEQMDGKGSHYLSDDSASQDPSAAIDSPDCPSSNSGGETVESNLTSFSNSSSSSQPFFISGSEMVSDDDVADANHNNCSKYVIKHDEAIPTILNLDAINALSLIQQQPESQGQSLQQNQEEESIGEEQEEEGVASDHLSRSEGKELAVDHVYEETEPKIQAKDFLRNRKYLMACYISVETPSKRVGLMSSPATANRRLLLHPGSFNTDQCFIGDSRPALTGSLGCLSQGTSKLAKVTRVDIPPPFELASITKRPIRKSSPSLPNEVSASCKKPDFGFKRYLLPLRFLRKSDRKSMMDNRSISSRSSSESSPQGSCKRLDFIRHNMGSPDLQSTPDCTPPMSPSSFVFQKNRQKQGLNLTLKNDLASSTISMELGSLFEPHPIYKPSFSSPNTDSSDYENVQNAASHYENVQIRLLNPVIQSQRNQSSTSDTDGYVDMSSLPGFQGKSQPSEQETDSLYTFCSPNVRQDGTVGVSVGMACTQEKKTKASDKLTVNCSRAFYSAKELLDSEAQHVKTLQLLCESVEADERLMTVWAELPDIYTLHQSIHTLLETRLKEWDQNESIAEIILAKKKEFSIFSSYISHYDDKLNYLEHIQSTLPDAVTLKKQLLQVIVRILQYRMLLTDYLNNLSPDSKEFENTQDTLVVVSDIAHHVNDSLKNGADLLRLVHIEHSVLGLTDLLQPGRVFVKEGTLMKVSRKCKQPRHLFLMNDIMLYTYPQQDGKYRLINRLPLAGMEVSKPPIENAQSALKIDVKDISITLSANSCIERDGWFVALNRTLVNRGPVSGDPVHFFGLVDGPEKCLGENAPPLLSVSQVTVCMNCHSHFSLTNRRHHCHACGKICAYFSPDSDKTAISLEKGLVFSQSQRFEVKNLLMVVCRDCCRNKFPLKYMKNRHAKVCDHCYSELRKHDAATLTESSSRPLSSVFQNIHPSSLWKSRKGQLSFNQETVPEGGMSGTLQRCRNSKRSWRSLWFLLKDKVLYTYPQPEERVACETLPLLGFSVRSEIEGESSMFQLYHKSTLFYTFRAQDSHVAQRWVNAMEEATVL